MNIALIIAGGSGQRMKQDIPKQFLNVHDKPVIIYTLQAFQKHPNVDAIAVVCLKGWEEILKAYAKQFDINKLKWIFPGGENGQESLKNGILGLRDFWEQDKTMCSPAPVELNDITVIIHDAIRPLVSQEIISDNISCCKIYGSAITTIPCQEAMLVTQDKESASDMFERSNLARTQTPQSFPLDKLVWAHEEAKKQGITNSIATCTLMISLGEKVHFSTGSERNLKLTTTDDIEIFKALLQVSKDEWMK